MAARGRRDSEKGILSAFHRGRSAGGDSLMIKRIGRSTRDRSFRPNSVARTYFLAFRSRIQRPTIGIQAGWMGIESANDLQLR